MTKIEKVSADVGLNSKETAPDAMSISTDTDISIREIFDFVKLNDKKFEIDSKQPVYYDPKLFSKVVNKDSTPKVVYHGTDKSFSVFQSKDGTYWFSESRDYAESMAEERGGNIVMETYLAMKNPYYAKLPEGQFSDPLFENPVIAKAKAEGYDGVIFETDTDNKLVYDKFYVVFKPEQIKSATDNIGTFDRNNPDTRFSVSKNNVDTENKMSYNNSGSNNLKEGIESETEHKRGTVQTEALYGRGANGVVENTEDKGRWDSSNSGNLSVGNSAVENNASAETENRRRKYADFASKAGSVENMATASHGTVSEKAESGRISKGRRILEAIKSGDIETAKNFLTNNQLKMDIFRRHFKGYILTIHS